MSSNNTSPNNGKTGGQPQRNAGTSSSGAGGLINTIFPRSSPKTKPQGLPEPDVEGNGGAAGREDQWEDIPERPSRTTGPPRSIMHTPLTPSRENRVSFEGDRKTNSDDHSRRGGSANGSARSGRGIGEFVAQNLHESNNLRASTSAATTGRNPAHTTIPPSSSGRQPVPAEAHPLATSQYPPLDPDTTFLDPGNAPLGAADFDPSRPLTPDVNWGEGEREAVVGAGAGAPLANPEARAPAAPQGVTGFEMEEVPPFELDPHSPLANHDPNFVPPRTLAPRLGSGNTNGGRNGSKHDTPPRQSPRNDANGTPPRRTEESPGEFPMGRKGLLKPNANVAAENAARRAAASGRDDHVRGETYSPRQPRREREVEPIRAHRSTAGAGPSTHRATRAAPGAGGRRRGAGGGGGERERRERERQRRPYRPQDPYAYPTGQKKSPIPPFLGAVRWAVDWAEDKFGLGEEEEQQQPGAAAGEPGSAGGAGQGTHGKPDAPPAGDSEGESIPMTGRRPAWMRRARRGTKPHQTPASPPPSTGRIPLNETKAERAARELGEREAHATRVNARRLEREIQGRKRRLAVEQAEKEHHRRMTDEEIKEELEQGLPVVPRTSPTRATHPKNPITGFPSRTRPPVEPHPSGTESAPVGRIPQSAPAGAGQPSRSQKPTPEQSPGKGKAGTLSPPKASPVYHPPSDPGSPVKHASPFNVNLPFGIPKANLDMLRDAEKQVELTLRKWSRDALIQVYRHLLLRMPSLYFNRVGRVFQEADFSEREIAELIIRGVQDGPRSDAARLLDHPTPWKALSILPGIDNDESEPLMNNGRGSNSPSPNQHHLLLADMEDHSDLEAGSIFGGGSTLAGQGAPERAEARKRWVEKVDRFRIEWEGFVDGMIKEWKTLNVVSALLLSALLTIFQIQEAAYVPVTRTAALLSLVSAFMSLLFGGVYIIRFSTMRTMRKAAKWVEETHKKKQKLAWNIWILLSLPVTWLVYSLIFFCIAILGFVWTSGTGTHTTPPSDDDRSAVILGPRIGITVLFAIGFIYFCLVLNTFRVWSGVTISSSNDTLVNLHSPDMAAARLDVEARASGDRGDDHSPPTLGKGTNAPGAILPTVMEHDRSGADGIEALKSANRSRETREQRTEELVRRLEGRPAMGPGSTGSAPSVLGLEFTPAAEERPPILRHSPNLALPYLTATPPGLMASGLPLPNTVITQPTPITPAPPSAFNSGPLDVAPLTALDPLMDPNGPWGLPDPLPANSPPFTRHSQALDLEHGLPDRRTPPSTFASVYATPMGESVSEFGTINRAGAKPNRGT